MSIAICHPPADWTCAGTPDWLAEQDPVMVDIAESFAWSVLASLCAYQIASCPITVRPCAAGCFTSGTWLEAVVGGASTSGLPVARLGGTVFTPHLTGGNWVNSCGCSSGCSCTALSEAILPGPVGGIVNVKLDGIVQDPATYRVDNGNILVSLDPDRPWPLRQNMLNPVPRPTTLELEAPEGYVTLFYNPTTGEVGVDAGFSDTPDLVVSWPAGTNPWPGTFEGYENFPGTASLIIAEDGSIVATMGSNPVSPTFGGSYNSAPGADKDWSNTFEVTYYQGAEPDTITSYAAGVLANEYLLACKKDSKCRLPRNATTVTRGGTTIELEPDLRKAMLSIPEVAAVVQIFNPNGLVSAPRVLSPSTRRPRQTTWIG